MYPPRMKRTGSYVASVFCFLEILRVPSSFLFFFSPFLPEKDISSLRVLFLDEDYEKNKSGGIHLETHLWTVAAAIRKINGPFENIRWARQPETGHEFAFAFLPLFQ